MFCSSRLRWRMSSTLTSKLNGLPSSRRRRTRTRLQSTSSERSCADARATASRRRSFPLAGISTRPCAAPIT